MDYGQALTFIHSLGRLSPKPGLERMKELLAALGNPQRRLCFVHIAGTNGKGSTTVMLAGVLAEAGYKVGANISPYVSRFEERFQTNGRMIEQQRLAEILTQVYDAAQTMENPPLEFEAVTAAAFLYFAQENCDIVCLETGIGGRWDATNVVENTLVACITKVGCDHKELLGETLEEITAEKCGIIKNRCPVVSYPAQAAPAARVIKERARQAGSALHVPRMKDISFLETSSCALPLTQSARYKDMVFDLQLAGRHQVLNASMVIEIVYALREKGYSIPDASVIEGIEKVRMPARIEAVSYYSPLMIVDGGHDEDAALALAATLEEHQLGRFVAVAGFLADKSAGVILHILKPFIKKLYVVTPDSPRALPAQQAAVVARKYIDDVTIGEDLPAVLENAVKEAGAQDAGGLLVFGSFYVAGRARDILM